MVGMWMLMLLGIAQAVTNLPVVTGCGFYGICGNPDKPVASDRMTDRVDKDE